MRSAILLSALLLAGFRTLGQAPADTVRLVTISPQVGEVVDTREKATYGLFPYYSADNFVEARLYQALRPDSALTLRTQLRDGRTALRPVALAELTAMRRSIQERARTVGAAPPLPAAADSLGHRYQVTLRSGTVFKGILTALRPRELEFDTPDLGRVVTPRASIVALQDLTSPNRARDYVGNGTRLFFAPTARNLRRGEGYVQNINFLVIGANYGVSDHVSVGMLASLIPGIRLSDQALAVTPKFSTSLSNDQWHVGGGVLYARAAGTGLGVAYGVGTYGSADRNLTFGLGYGFGEGGFGNRPVFVLGGASRVGRRISLVSENYLFAVGGTDNLALGLYGLRLSWPILSFSLGAGYAIYDQRFLSTYVYPLYLDLTFRFGQVK
jgi:hypothetical protein